MLVSHDRFHNGSGYANRLQLDLYDFFMHGDVKALETANGIRTSDVWFALNGKCLTVRS